jgi:hypothetical protein
MFSSDEETGSENVQNVMENAERRESIYFEGNV